jgi:hypothetical protein
LILVIRVQVPVEPFFFFNFFLKFNEEKKNNNKKKWRSRVSIPVPSACKADALPFELHPLIVFQRVKKKKWAQWGLNP